MKNFQLSPSQVANNLESAFIFVFEKCSKIQLRRNIQLSVDGIRELLWFRFTSLRDWFRKLAPPYKPIRDTLNQVAILSRSVIRASERLLVLDRPL